MLSLLKRIPRLQKLNSAGVGHHILIAVLVISGFAGLGAYRVFMSSAATQYSIGLRETKTSNGVSVTGCWLAGRVWDESAAAGEKCKDKCRINGIELVPRDAAKDRPAYCKGHVALANEKTTEDACVNQQHRWWINNLGCARKANQENANEAKRYCPNTKFPNYVAENTVDRCIAATIADTGGGSTNPSSTTDTMSEEMCKLLGRESASATACKRVCTAGAGTMLTKDGKIYCQRAVGEGITAERCKQLNRKWVGVGCARLVGQQDTMGALQCLAGFPYYNANFKPSNGEPTLTDVCEKDKKTADKNEQTGTLGGVVVGDTKPDDQTPPTDDCNEADSAARCAPQDDADDLIPANYRIILFKEKDFKGDKLEAFATLNEDDSVSMTVKLNDKKQTDIKDLAQLPRGWNDKVKSFKILKGRWQLCEDSGYQKGCIKPYASNPDLTDGRDRKKISSLRPFVRTVVDETVEEIPAICMDATGQPVPMGADGKCPDESKLTCPPTDANGAKLERRGTDCVAVTVEPDVIVPVDGSFKGKQGERKCKLLGREWVSKGNGGEHGCSIETCRSNKDGRPRTVQTTGNSDDDKQKRTDTVCISYLNDAPYAVKLDSKAKTSEKKCKELSRIWIEQVKLCAQVPNRDDKNHTIVKAEQCAGKKTTYYIYKEKAKTDECFNPSLFQRAKGVAKATGGSLSAALKQGPKAYCKVVKGGKYHWQDGKCVIDRHKCWNGNSIPVTQKCPPKPAPQGGTNNGGSGADGDTSYCQSNPNASGCGSVNNHNNNNGNNNGGGGNWTVVNMSCSEYLQMWNEPGWCVPPRWCEGWYYKNVELRGYPYVYKSRVGFCRSFGDPTGTPGV